MKRIITPFFISALLLAGLTVSAQQSEDVLLYKISPDEARSLYKGEKPGDHHFHTLQFMDHGYSENWYYT
ncbi:MAG: hypothetical protein MI974_17105 [Chitinophagales bacterium]|nr:hypothetical protein [Chitinophagales bacterium]